MCFHQTSSTKRDAILWISNHILQNSIWLNLKLSTNQETENTVIIHQQNQHHLLMLGPAVVFAQPTTGSIVFPLNSCEEHAPVFLNFPGNSLLELPFKERFFFTRFRLSNNTVLRGGTCEAPSTQPPACGQPQGLDWPLSQDCLSLGKLFFSLENTCWSGEFSSCNLRQIGQEGSLFCVFGVVCSKHSAWKTWRHERTPTTGMSPLLTMRRELQGDLCERNLSHNPHLKVSDGTYDWPKLSDSNGSETSAKSTLLLALLQQWASLCGVEASSSDNTVDAESIASLLEVWVGKDKG